MNLIRLFHIFINFNFYIVCTHSQALIMNWVRTLSYCDFTLVETHRIFVCSNSVIAYELGWNSLCLTEKP